MVEDTNIGFEDLELPGMGDTLAKPASTLPNDSFDGFDDVESTDGSLEDLFAQVKENSANNSLRKPWMKFHQFVLIKTVDQMKELVDRAIENGACSLDLETEGLDNRINYDENGKPYTVHKVVGYCISVRGVGHYIPVRHSFEEGVDKDPNVPAAGVEEQIKRLCWAAQPEITEEGLAEDPFGSKKIKTPGKLIIYFWHAKFDQEFLYPITGIDFWHPQSFEDGYLAGYTVYTDDNHLGLKEKAKSNLRIQDPETEAWHPYEMIKITELFERRIRKADIHFGELYPEEGSDVVAYGCSDGICTELLCESRPDVQWTHLAKVKVDYKEVVGKCLKKPFAATYRLEKQTVQAVRVLERTRGKIDKPGILGLLEEAKTELADYETKIKTLAETKGFKDFNPGSSGQLSEFLFSENGLNIKPKPPKNEASDQYKTDAKTLEKLFEAKPDVEVLSWIVKYRQVDKIIGTYLESLAKNCDEEDCLRFQFKQTGAATGRFTAPAGQAEHGYSGIPIQGIPAKVDPKRPKVANSLRRLFIARDGHTLVKIDYAGQELRIVANLSGEPLWIKEFLEGTGDLHTLTAQSFFGPHITKADKTERNSGKIANFSLIYGGGVQAIQRAVPGCDEAEAARKKASFDKSVPVFAKWVVKQHAYVKEHKGVYTAFGRFISIPDAAIKEGDKLGNGQLAMKQDVRRIRASCERKSTNFPIQGSGADILKISLVKLLKELHKRRWLKNGGDDSVRMIMTIHDEIVFEIRNDRLQEAVPLVSAIMESPSDIVSWKVPLIVEPLLGQSWDAKHDWDAIMAGKKPIPEWLEGTLQIGPARVDINSASLPPLERKPLPSSDLAAVPDKEFPPLSPEDGLGELPIEELPPVKEEKKEAAPKKPKEPATTSKYPTAEFRIARAYLTRRSIYSVHEAIGRSIPLRTRGRTCWLRLLDGEGNLLIDVDSRFIVDPQKFSEELRERNLGSGGYREFE